MTIDEVDKKMRKNAEDRYAWRDRLIIERAELTDKLGKLVAALGGDIGSTVASSSDLSLMFDQAEAMLKYQHILTLRLRQSQGAFDVIP